MRTFRIYFRLLEFGLLEFSLLEIIAKSPNLPKISAIFQALQNRLSAKVDDVRDDFVDLHVVRKDQYGVFRHA